MYVCKHSGNSLHGFFKEWTSLYIVGVHRACMQGKESCAHAAVGRLSSMCRAVTRVSPAVCRAIHHTAAVYFMRFDAVVDSEKGIEDVPKKQRSDERKKKESGFWPCVSYWFPEKGSLKHNRVVIDQKAYLLTYLVVCFPFVGHPVPPPQRRRRLYIYDIHLIIFNARRRRPYRLWTPNFASNPLYYIILLSGERPSVRGSDHPFARVYRTGWKLYALKCRPRRTISVPPQHLYMLRAGAHIVYGIATAAAQTMIHAKLQAPGPRRFTIMEITAAAATHSYNNNNS